MTSTAVIAQKAAARRALPFPRENNLEWLRLIFALQVVLGHAKEHMGLPLPDFIYHFPGVPAFFFVSGFLIYSSYLNAPGARYFQNRVLRLYPALCFVILGGVIVTAVAHGWGSILSHARLYLAWVAAQATLGQAWNPAYFRDIGVGVINGSLWTLTVEILFYLCVPVIVWLERRFRATVLLLMAGSLGTYVIYLETPRGHHKGILDFLAITPVVWGWMFGCGILAVKHFEVFRRTLRFAPLALPAMIPLWVWGHGVLFGSWGNEIGIAYYVLYVTLIGWLAFGIPYIRLPFDLSYGIYIWHMPVLNLLLVLGIHRGAVMIGATVAIAALSWFVVEKPALALKKKSLRPVK